MAPTYFDAPLIQRLPQVRGRYSFEVDLSKTTWFRVGGAAQVLYKPADIEDLAFFLREKPADLPATVIGVGSNLLVRDAGVPGVVIRLGQGFNNLLLKDGKVDVGAGALDRTVAMVTQEEAVTGLEFLCGVPGTIGGALRMNAGCYGSEIKDVLEVAFALDSKGRLKQLTPEDLGYSYRHCSLASDWIFVGARLKVKAGDSKAIAERIQKFLREREETQPVKTRTGGSTFANPEGLKAWKLIDEAGCRGLRKGGAMVSEMHCNFLINTGPATAEDLEELGEEVRTRVRACSGVELRWEIQRIGLKADALKAPEKAA